MSILIQVEPLAYALRFEEETLIVFLKDGRSLHLPLVWYPLLNSASRAEQENFQILGDGEGIHWPDLDEDLSVAGFLQGISLSRDVA